MSDAETQKYAQEMAALAEWSGQSRVLEYLGELVLGGPNTRFEPFSEAGGTMVGRIQGGHAKGPVLNGEILPVGDDWVLMRPDGVFEIAVKTVLRTNDGADILIRYEARWSGPPEKKQKLMAGEEVPAHEYYLRSLNFFQTMHPRYAHLNGAVAVGYGRVDHGVGDTWRLYRLL